MKVTDEMVEVAISKVISCTGIVTPSSMRAALEAALGQFMLQYGDNVELQEAEQIGFNRSAICIEDLAGALKPFAKESDNWGTTPDDDSPLAYTFDLPDGYGIQQVMCGFTAKDFYRARATLERWGLK